MISIILPAYQEAENLKNILPKLHESLKQLGVPYEILIIDTMQPMDDTREICYNNNASYFPREGGNLYGDAIRTGFFHAQGKYTVVMDADGSHNPEDIIRFYKEMKSGNYDLVIGSRYCKGGYTDNNFILKSMSWILNVTYRILFHLKVKDVSDSFRMYKTNQLKKLELECDNFDVVEEILIKLSLLKQEFVTKEVPISFNKRVEGESKRDLGKFIKSYLKTINRLLKIRRHARREKQS